MITRLLIGLHISICMYVYQMHGAPKSKIQYLLDAYHFFLSKYKYLYIYCIYIHLGNWRYQVQISVLSLSLTDFVKVKYRSTGEWWDCGGAHIPCLTFVIIAYSKMSPNCWHWSSSRYLPEVNVTLLWNGIKDTVVSWAQYRISTLYWYQCIHILNACSNQKRSSPLSVHS